MKKETIELIKAALSVLVEAKKQGALMIPVEVGDRLGISAFQAGHLFLIMGMPGRQLVEKPDEKENRYRITQKGEKFLVNPPPPEEIKREKPSTTPSTTPSATPSAAPSATPSAAPSATPSTTPSTTPSAAPSAAPSATTPETPEDKLKVVFPSQAATFSSIGETLGFEKGVGDQKKPSLESVVEYVRRLANMDDLDSVESVLTEFGLSPDIRKRWLRLYALTLPAKKAKISPELKVRLGLEEEEGRAKPQPMYNVIEGRIYPEPDGEYTFAKAVQKVSAEKATADPAALITAIMPILTKEPPPSTDPAALITAIMPLLTKESPPSTDTAALITALMPILTKETPPPPQQDTTLFQSLQTRIEQLADERNKAQIDAVRAEMRATQRPPEADAQIQALTQVIETLREELHAQQLERIKEQHEAATNLLTNKFSQLEKEVQASMMGKSVDSKYGLMSEGLKGILGEIGGARRDIKEIVPTFVQRREKAARTPEQKASFDQGMEQAIERQKKSREMEDRLFFSKEG